MTTLRVRYGETDQMGVVYHSNYLRYFEVARGDYYRQLGYPYQQLEAQGIMLPLTSCKVNFKSPAKYDEELSLTVQLSELSVARLTLNYCIVRAIDGQIFATGSTSHAFTNCSLKPINIKKHQPAFFELLYQQLHAD